VDSSPKPELHFTPTLKKILERELDCTLSCYWVWEEGFKKGSEMVEKEVFTT
jgi:hypothetical protein